jgi:hypothetical protein
MSKFIGKLPNGKTTTNSEFYELSWNKVILALSKLGYDTVAIDPTINISKGGKSFNIPCDIILKLMELDEALLKINIISKQ